MKNGYSDSDVIDVLSAVSDDLVGNVLGTTRSRWSRRMKAPDEMRQLHEQLYRWLE